MGPYIYAPSTIRAACSHSSVRELLGPDTRPDIMARIKYVEDHLALGLVPPPTPCMDPMVRVP